MIEKLETSWKLAKESWRILLLDKEMLWFPILSGIVCLLFLSLLGVFFWANNFFYNIPADTVPILPILDPRMLFIAALLTVVPSYFLYVIVSFFNSALVTCALIRLHGEDPVLSDGFSHAFRRFGPVLKWSMLAATVGLILRFFKKRPSILGRIFGEVLGLGWRVASFFVIPILVSEDKGPIDALKGSVGLIKKNWGEALTFEVGIAVLSAPLVIPAAFVCFFGFSLLETTPIIAIPLVVLALGFIVAVSVVMSTLDTIIKAALYLHANGELASDNFEPELLDQIVKQKNAGKPALA